MKSISKLDEATPPASIRTEPSVQNLGGALNAALEIAQRRRDTLARLKVALTNENFELAIALAKRLCGLTDE